MYRQCVERESERKKEEGYYQPSSCGRSYRCLSEIWIVTDNRMWSAKEQCGGRMEEECFNELLGERRGPGPVVARCERITSVNNATLYLRYLFLMMANIPDTNRSPSVISSRSFSLLRINWLMVNHTRVRQTEVNNTCNLCNTEINESFYTRKFAAKIITASRHTITKVCNILE